MKRTFIPALLAAQAMFAQAAFEAATVKPNRTGSNAMGGRGLCGGGSGGVSIHNYPLSRVIEQAYGIKGFQLVGRPSWLSASTGVANPPCGMAVAK